MNNSLRDEIKKIQYWQGTDGDPDFPEDVYDSIPDEVIDQILSLIASKMPEKKVNTNYNEIETLYPDLPKTLPDVYDTGFNQAIDSVKSILKGEESQ
jgi:hypothetical protein